MLPSIWETATQRLELSENFISPEQFVEDHLQMTYRVADADALIEKEVILCKTNAFVNSKNAEKLYPTQAI